MKHPAAVLLKSPKRLVYAGAALALLCGMFGYLHMASAASLTNSYLRFSRLATAQSASVRVVFKTTSAGATSVAINFNSDTNWLTNSGAVNGTQTVSSASCATDTGATALPGTLAASGSSGTVTITGVTALSATTSYCVDLTSSSAVTTPNSAGNYVATITAGSDTVSIATNIITNDQVVVSAVVSPTFSFALSGNTDSFTSGLASTAVTSTTGVTATVNTNAKTGWIAWVKDSNSGLTSATQSKTIASVTAGSQSTLTAGTEGYGVGITNISQGSGVGTTTAVAAYDSTSSGGVNAKVGGVDTALRKFASSDGTAASATLTVKERAAISSTTPAANDYTDTLTFIGAGSF